MGEGAFFKARRRGLRANRGSILRGLGMTAAVVLAQSCNHGIDTTRSVPKATLGDDIYGMMCDRLGASSLAEDLTGASYHSICHFDAVGNYGDTVDTSVLPPVSGDKAKTARALSIAKMQAMAQHRSALIRAFNAAFPDIKMADLSTANPNDTIRLHDALLVFSQELTKLYETNPYDVPGAPLMPSTTDAIGNLFAKLEENDGARQALMRIAGRQGYRPFKVGMGAIRTMLSYPELRKFVKSQLKVLGPSGGTVPELQQLLTVTKRELETSQCELCKQPPLVVDTTNATLNRPRYAVEVLERLLLDQDDAYRASGDAPRYITRRDSRGFVIPFGNTPGMPGTVKAPFADANKDGFADVDAVGRFVDDKGAALAIDPPFVIPGKAFGKADEFGRNGSNIYAYLDTSRTLVGALTRDLVPLLDPNTYAGPGAAQPWTKEHETLMYSLAGVHVLAGDRVAAQFDHEHDTILDASAQCTSAKVPCTKYQRFTGEASPLPDLIHGLGQVLADPESDAIFQALEILIRDHEDVVARLMAAGLKIKAIADKHDVAAAMGKEPKAELPYETPVWDQIAQIVSDMTKHPGLVKKLVEALADDTIITAAPQDPKIQQPKAQHLGETLSAFMTMRDRYTYDPNDINGPAINVTDGNGSIANPHNPVDYTKPLNGSNRSMFEASAQLIFDAAKVKACNKPGARLHTTLLDLPPFGGTYEECKLFEFSNMGGFYLDALLPSTHPKRALLQVKDGALNELLKLVGSVANVDNLLSASAGISGLTMHPTPAALNRLLFFGAMSDRYGKLADYDAKNANTDTGKFVSWSIDATCGPVCPANGNGVPVCSQQQVNDVLRLRDRSVIFAWERLGFQTYLQPQMKAFAEVGCNPSGTVCSQTDYTGENYFLDLVSTLWKHWPDKNHGSYCDHTVPPTEPRYCSGAGINHYEPILGEAFLTDIIPALHAFSKVASQVDIVVERGPNKGKKIRGSEIVEKLVRIMFSQDYSAQLGVTDRLGNKGTKWVDGTPQKQITVYSIFADALHAMDMRFDKSGSPDAADRKAKWKRARSQLVDQFLQVDGSGTNARFANRAAPKTLLVVLKILREQTNAHCANRETTKKCDWARYQLGKKLADTLSRPTFAAIADVSDKLNSDEPARRELERFATWALQSASGGDALHGMLASIADLMQLLRADGDFSPIFNAVSIAASPKQDAAGPGCADRAVQVLDAMNGDSYDRYHVMDHVLPALVTPMNGGQGLTPIEVILDAVAGIHRIDAKQVTPLDEQDYKYVMKTVREFFTSPTRGFQQLYYIVQNRPD